MFLPISLPYLLSLYYSPLSFLFVLSFLSGLSIMQVFGSNYAWRRNSAGVGSTQLAWRGPACCFLGSRSLGDWWNRWALLHFHVPWRRRYSTIKTQLVLFKSTGYLALQELMPWKWYGRNLRTPVFIQWIKVGLIFLVRLIFPLACLIISPYWIYTTRHPTPLGRSDGVIRVIGCLQCKQFCVFSPSHGTWTSLPNKVCSIFQFYSFSPIAPTYFGYIHVISYLYINLLYSPLYSSKVVAAYVENINRPAPLETF